MFSPGVETSQSYHFQAICINYENTYGTLIRECPTTLFEGQERACEIEENLATSLIQEEENLIIP